MTQNDDNPEFRDLGLTNNLLILFLSGVIIVIIQNSFIFIRNLASLKDQDYMFDTFNALLDVNIDYLIDIIGFSCIGIALIQNNASYVVTRTYLQRSGIAFIIWAILRSIWQFIILPDTWHNIDVFTVGDISFDTELILFFLSVIAFSVAIYYLMLFYTPASKNMMEQIDESWFLFFYLLINLVSSGLIVLIGHSKINLFPNLERSDYISYFPKLIIAPLLAVLSFVFILKPYFSQINISVADST